jgi:predicted enzyme related to lactoylglutathione lyase
MNPVVHFEMPYDDPQRASKFYTAAFGWKMKDLGEKMGHYITAATSATGAEGLPTKPGRSNGGLFAKKPDWPAQYPSVVIAVDDIRNAMGKVTGAGGQVLGDPMDIPGIGAYVSFMDSEGNRVGMLQPLPMKKAAKTKAMAKKKPAASKKKKTARKS